MGLNSYFLRLALPSALFKISSKYERVEDFFKENNIVGVGMDSRTVQPREIFIALQGERVDGHDFIQEALQKGAVALIIKKTKEDYLKKIDPKLLASKLVVLVENTFDALIQLAKNWRQKFDYPVVAITGSVGKTTSKALVANICKVAKFPAFISHKNQNTVIGLSLNILQMRVDHKAAIFEVGISQSGEMEIKADILRPTMALITCVAHAHTQGLGKIAQVAHQKRQIFKYCKPNDIGIINGDQLLLSDSYYYHPVVRFGLKTKNQVQARKIKVVYDKTNQ